jgi:hypothetical protein
MVRFRGLCVLLALAIVAPSLLADGTIRYSSSITRGPMFAAISPASKKPVDLTPRPPTFGTMRLKNGKLEEDSGAFMAMYDSKNSQITLTDPARKVFATGTLEDFVGQILASRPARSSLPPQAQMILKSTTTAYASRKTGRTRMTLGLETEETEVTLSLNLTMPPAMLALMPNAGLQPGAPVTFFKVVIHMWRPTQAEIQRVPALREFASFWAEQAATNANLEASISAALQKALGNYPGLGDGLTPMLEDSFKNQGTILKADVELYAPGLAQAGPMLKAQGLVENFDVNAPLLEFTTEAVEVSSAPIDDSAFAAPSDERATTVADFLHGARPPMGVDTRGGRAAPPGPGMPSQPGDSQGLGRLPFR